MRSRRSPAESPEYRSSGLPAFRGRKKNQCGLILRTDGSLGTGRLTNSYLQLPSRAAILFATLSQPVIACLNACPRAIAGEAARRGTVGTHRAITLRKNNSTVVDFKSTCVVVGQRHCARRQDGEGGNHQFHLNLTTSSGPKPTL